MGWRSRHRARLSRATARPADPGGTSHPGRARYPRRAGPASRARCYRQGGHQLLLLPEGHPSSSPPGRGPARGPRPCGPCPRDPNRGPAHHLAWLHRQLGPWLVVNLIVIN